MTEDIFENNHREIVAERVAAETLIVDVDGYEGPLDLLLTLSRTQKVDLRKISILDLAKQYLEFVGAILFCILLKQYSRALVKVHLQEQSVHYGKDLIVKVLFLKGRRLFPSTQDPRSVRPEYQAVLSVGRLARQVLYMFFL